MHPCMHGHTPTHTHSYIYIDRYIDIDICIVLSFTIFIIKRELDIREGAYVDLSLNSIDTESMVLSDNQFLTYAIIN